MSVTQLIHDLAWLAMLTFMFYMLFKKDKE